MTRCAVAAVTVSLRPRGLWERYGGEVLGKASSGLRWREEETRGYSCCSECSELVREEWLVDDGGSNGGGGIGQRCGEVAGSGTAVCKGGSGENVK